ncbi:MAG: dihydropteroate synthase [Alphaproteobacteria bacterium]
MTALAALLPLVAAGRPFYLTPVAFAAGVDVSAMVRDGVALPFAGGPAAFTAVELAVRDADGIAAATVAVATLARDATSPALERRMAALSAPPPPFAGLPGPIVMGIVNVTPDSFSDGGDRLDPDAAVAAGLEMAAAGAALVDVGGESTRPGSLPVPEDEELRRVLPVVRRLAEAGLRVSVDTRRPAVMRAAAAAGAAVLNDVTALEGDPKSTAAAIETGLPVVLMHMQGEPRTMQRDPTYVSAPHDIHDYLAGRVAALATAGLPPERLAIDPGIGFGKTIDHNLAILRRLALFRGLGRPVLVGLSRKGFVGRLAGGAAPRDRLGGSVAGALWALSRGADILRVHDVAATVQAVAMWRALAAEAVP